MKGDYKIKTYIFWLLLGRPGTEREVPGETNATGYNQAGSQTLTSLSPINRCYAWEEEKMGKIAPHMTSEQGGDHTRTSPWDALKKRKKLGYYLVQLLDLPPRLLVLWRQVTPHGMGFSTTFYSSVWFMAGLSGCLWSTRLKGVVVPIFASTASWQYLHCFCRQGRDN